MALLIAVGQPNWMSDEALAAELAPLLPGVDIRCAADPGDASDIVMLACSELAPGLVRQLPNLRLVQKLGAGVETILADRDLPPRVRVARLKPEAPAREIAEYCLAHVLREQRHLADYEADQRARRWGPRPPREAPATTVGVLGLGHIGSHVARTFAALSFRVLGWSRLQKTLPGIECRRGPETLGPILGASDHVIAVLPSTAETRNLADTRFLEAMKRGAVFLNVGRGDLVVEADLLAALDSGHLARAVLDVHGAEPLPRNHPFWSHPRITLTPHVSGWHVTGGLEAVAENYRRLVDGSPLLNEVDREAGY